MKKGLYLAGVAVLLAFVTNASHARVPSRATAERADGQTQTFVGEITRYPTDRYPVPYVIYDQNRKDNFYIDDTSKVAKYDGKTVEITGTLDDHSIKVQSVMELH